LVQQLLSAVVEPLLHLSMGHHGRLLAAQELHDLAKLRQRRGEFLRDTGGHVSLHRAPFRQRSRLRTQERTGKEPSQRGDTPLRPLEYNTSSYPQRSRTRWQRRKRRRDGLANYRLVRFADDWCLCVSGTKADAETLREEIAGVLSTMGLRLSPEKTLVTHIDE